MNAFFIARNKDNKLYQFDYWEGMLATSMPHRHVSVYPFDGNYYYEGNDYNNHEGRELEGDQYPFITYDNSPYLVVQDGRDQKFFCLSDIVFSSDFFKYIETIYNNKKIFENNCK